MMSHITFNTMHTGALKYFHFCHSCSNFHSQPKFLFLFSYVCSFSSECFSFIKFWRTNRAATSASALMRAEEVDDVVERLEAELRLLDPLLPTLEMLSLGFISSWFCMEILDIFCSLESRGHSTDSNGWSSASSLELSIPLIHCFVCFMRASLCLYTLENQSFCLVCSSLGNNGITESWSLIASSKTCTKLSRSIRTAETFSFLCTSSLMAGIELLITFRFRSFCSCSILLAKAFAVSWTFLLPLSCSGSTSSLPGTCGGGRGRGAVGAWAPAPFPLDAQSALLSRHFFFFIFYYYYFVFVIKRPFVNACPI